MSPFQHEREIRGPFLPWGGWSGQRPGSRGRQGSPHPEQQVYIESLPKFGVSQPAVSHLPPEGLQSRRGSAVQHQLPERKWISTKHIRNLKLGKSSSDLGGTSFWEKRLTSRRESWALSASTLAVGATSSTWVCSPRTINCMLTSEMASVQMNQY